MIHSGIYSIEGVIPVVDPTAYVHPSAVLIGDVIIEAGCYVGPCASLRGDFGRLVLRSGSNVQDNCTLHSLPGSDTIIGSNGHIGHGAIIHSAQVGENALIGMNAVIMDHAVIGASCIVGAMAFVTAGSQFPPNSLIAGIPAKVLRPLRDEDLLMKQEATRQYQELTRRSLATLKSATPLTTFDPTRKRVDEGLAVPERLRKRADRDRPSGTNGG